MNKIITIVAIVLFIITGGYWISDKLVLKNSDQKAQKLASTEINIPDSPNQIAHNHLIGDEQNILKGQGFTSPVDDLSTQTAEWISRPIRYSDKSKYADLVVTLDQQLYELLYEDIKRFAKIKNINVLVDKGTCGISARKLKKKSVDIAGFCCSSGEPDRLPGLKYHTLGISAVALLTNIENPLVNISSNDARKVFSGKLRRWNQLDGSKGNNRGIMIATRLHCKTRPGHWKLILGKEELFSTSAKEMADIPYMLTQINRHSIMLGYETLYMVNRENKPVKTLLVDNVNPGNLQALAKGHYPFYRSYNLATWTGQQARSIADEFVAYIKKIVVKQSEQYLIVPITELEKNGWIIKEGELIGEPRTLKQE